MNMPASDGAAPIGSEMEQLASLYSIEREAGFSVQNSLLAVWSAAVTYAGLAIGIYATVLDPEKSPQGGLLFDDLTKAWILLWLPFPAFAIAGYHAILFTIGLVHSRSIGLLENLLAGSAGTTAKGYHAGNLVGSRAETAWTERGAWTMRIVQALAYLPPYLAPILLLVLCFVNRSAAIAPASLPWILVMAALYLIGIVMMARLLYKGFQLAFDSPPKDT